MKKPLDITLRTVHIGDARRVVTLDIGGKDQARKFLSKLLKDDRTKWESLKVRIETVAKYDRYENDRTFNHVGGGIYEFKRPGLRLYAFYDEIDGLDHLILCTNGGTKNTRKEQQRDIRTARSRKEAYFAAKTKPDTKLTLEEPDP